jgi:SAM-dependent methyltransferase
MTVFGASANVYDLLYADKDYAGEAEYVRGLLSAHGRVSCCLELGCGTGRHAVAMARGGLQVHGVDRSSGMIEAAEMRRRQLPPEIGAALTFSRGDVRSVDVGRTFDAVTALFHVLSYQTTDEDVSRTLEAARRHLEPGGLFLFDFWHTPAILAEGPEARVKEVEDGSIHVRRAVTPDWERANRCIAVNYDYTVTSKAIGEVSRFSETHRMRYFAVPEFTEWLARFGFALKGSFAWLSLAPPSDHDWNVCLLAVANGSNGACCSR